MFSLRTTMKSVSTAALAATVMIAPAQAAHAFNCADYHVANVVNATNEYRVSNGLDKVDCDDELTAESQEWAETMRKADNGKGDHTFHDENTYAAENVAWGNGKRTPQWAADQWYNSPGHRANMLDPEASMIGVGWVEDSKKGTYAVQRFW